MILEGGAFGRAGGWSLQNGINVPIKDTAQSSPALLPPEDTVKKTLPKNQEGSTHPTVMAPDLGLPSFPNHKK